jgi:hypothetical protein
MSSASGARYRIAYSGRNISQLRGYYRLAKQENLQSQVLKNYSTIVQKLQTDPGSWGKPAGYLENLQLHLYAAVTPLFRVEYAVDESRRIVYIRNVHYSLGQNPPTTN